MAWPCQSEAPARELRLLVELERREERFDAGVVGHHGARAFRSEAPCVQLAGIVGSMSLRTNGRRPILPPCAAW